MEEWADDNLDGFLIPQAEGAEVSPVHVWESLEIQAARKKDRAGRSLHVLILVKTSPQLSKKYGDTVCVAGMALDEPVRWVRLYPIPFRYLNAQQQFNKYNIITVRVAQSSNDPRAESLKVNTSSIHVETNLGTSGGWAKRAQYVERLPEVSLCELQANIKADVNGPSLGLVRPQRGTFRLRITKNLPETRSQQEKRELILQRRASELEIDGANNHYRELAAPPPLHIKLHFTCAGVPSCKGHNVSYIDWEATALQFNNSALSSDELIALIQQKFETNPTSKNKDLRIYVGNLADATKRGSFQALGLYYPSQEASQAGRDVLF